MLSFPSTKGGSFGAGAKRRPFPFSVLLLFPEHTGDWKIDPEPLIGGKINSNRLKEIGNDGVVAMICDSTNTGQVYRQLSHVTVEERSRTTVKFKDNVVTSLTRKKNNGPGKIRIVPAPVIFHW